MGIFLPLISGSAPQLNTLLFPPFMHFLSRLIASYSIYDIYKTHYLFENQHWRHEAEIEAQKFRLKIPNKRHLLLQNRADYQQ